MRGKPYELSRSINGQPRVTVMVPFELTLREMALAICLQAPDLASIRTRRKAVSIAVKTIKAIGIERVADVVNIARWDSHADLVEAHLKTLWSV